MSRYKESWHDLLCLLFFLPAIRVRDSCHVVEPKGANDAEFYVSISRDLIALHKSQDFQILENWIMYTVLERETPENDVLWNRAPHKGHQLLCDLSKKLSRDCEFPIKYSAS